MEEIKQKIRDILSGNDFGMKLPSTFADNESLFLQGIIDSFGIFAFIKELEADFGINIKNSEIHPGNLETIESIAVFIYNKIKAKNKMER